MSTSGVPEQSKPQESRGFTDYSVIYESENGYSILYKVQKNGKWFALKGVKNEPGAKAKYESILRREFDLHKNVTSIYCAECYELINDPNVGLCIVMQYVDGITLNEWLKQRPSATEKSRVLKELLEAIGELHLKQIIHQDIKPSNIIITNNGHHVKLIDYGLSDNDAYIQKGRGFTNKYASPELINGGPVTFASDIWSLGCVINEIFPHRYRCVKARCQRKEPSKRYSSVGELSKALRRSDVARKACAWAALIMVVTGALVYSMIPHPTAKEITFVSLMQETHQKYDSCYNVCVATLDTCQYEEFCIIYIDNLYYSIDSIRQAMQPKDSIENKIFNDAYIEYFTKTLVPLQDKQKSKSSIHSMPPEQERLLVERWNRMFDEQMKKISNKH